MEWIIAIIVVIVIAWLAISVARRGKGAEAPPAGEPHRADPGEPDAPGGPGPGLGDEPRPQGPAGDPDPDEDADDLPRHERPPGDRFD